MSSYQNTRDGNEWEEDGDIKILSSFFLSFSFISPIKIWYLKKSRDLKMDEVYNV